jgi:pyruvate dehydrogenase phosphatase regulatory subunit
MFVSYEENKVLLIRLQIRYPLVHEFQSGRNIRTSPIHCELQARGAVFGERMGWEKPLYFQPHHGRDDPPAALPRGTFGKPEFFDYIEVQL